MGTKSILAEMVSERALKLLWFSTLESMKPIQGWGTQHPDREKYSRCGSVQIVNVVTDQDGVAVDRVLEQQADDADAGCG